MGRVDPSLGGRGTRMAAPIVSIPRPGVFATVRNRRGVVAAVEPFDGETGRLHLVHLEYKDGQLPSEERLLWELEPRRKLLEPNALPVADRSDPMPAQDYDAILRAARWTACTPFLDPDGDGPLDRLPIQSPFHGAVQIEDFQLVPLLKALRMPRVNLLIADDVGLGKTVEAGLILSELLLRRRIQRVLILTPASLRMQWRDEMWDKFSLPFDLIDRDSTSALRRQLGMDANPWRTFSRSIASYHYLRQPDVLDQFLAASSMPHGSAHLPWDLLIVDECHNLMPSAFGEDSDLCRMLRLIAPQFEHRLFLSATPHNGHTRSFSGLLEILDPVRFSQTDELKPAEKARIQQVVIRRLKRDINERTTPPKFCHRHPVKPLLLSLSRAELALSEAFSSFRDAVHKLTAKLDARGRRSGSFAVEILGKRLLSCSIAFAESWRRCKLGMSEAEAIGDAEVDVARRALEKEADDDREAQSREATAVTVVGAWLKGLATDLRNEIQALDRAVKDLGLDGNQDEIVDRDPVSDARHEGLRHLVETLLRQSGAWRSDERLVVFTEYKTTLDYLTRRLRQRYEPERILTLYGGMDESERDLVKQAFNDPANPVRILVATDAASEGLNLQRTARYLLHFDCPWNPSKLEQRNGRIDRHGQARDVTIHYFMTDQDQDIRFQAHVIGKADEMREDLGSINELFDEAAHRRLVDGENVAAVQKDLDLRVAAARGRASVPADATVATGQEADGVAASEQVDALAAEFDLDPRTLRETLEAALAIRAGRPQLEDAPGDNTVKLLNPGLPGWAEVIDESLRRQIGKGQRGPVSRLAFDNRPFLTWIGEREIFCPRPDVLRMHLSHPMLQRALSTLTRRRYPSSGDEVSRWTVRTADLPDGVDAQVLLSIEELAVNELRETFHHWIRTLVFQVRKQDLGDPLPHQNARALAYAHETHIEQHRAKARDLLEEIEPALKRHLDQHTQQLTSELRKTLAAAGVEAKKRELERYKSRQGEISTLIAESTLEKLEREIAKLKRDRQQGLLFEGQAQLDEVDRSIEQKQEELKRRRSHYEEVREQLDRERERVLERLLPLRHSMTAPAQVFPVTLEVRLPGGHR
jgi:superfamily II DNA or RNA helicase